MSLNRGDVGLIRFPHAGGTRGKKRPVIVVQADSYNTKVKHVIVVEAATNRGGRGPASLLIEVTITEGQATGLSQHSVVCCLFLATVAEDRFTRIGQLSDAMKRKLDGCLKTALGLP
jgi:mRNA-degrading endonuclease toxin of MazEF toxin-antitoxin module